MLLTAGGVVDLQDAHARVFEYDLVMRGSAFTASCASAAPEYASIRLGNAMPAVRVQAIGEPGEEASRLGSCRDPDEAAVVDPRLQDVELARDAGFAVQLTEQVRSERDCMRCHSVDQQVERSSTMMSASRNSAPVYPRLSR